MNRRSGLTLVVTLAMLVLAACGGNSQPAAKNDAPADKSAAPAEKGAAPASTPATLKMGTIVCVDLCGWHMVAEDKGYFKQAGLTIERTFNPSSTPLMKALVAGELDVIEISPPEALIAKAAGGKVKIIGMHMSGTAFSIIAKSSIKTLKDLQTATLGTSSPGAPPYTMALGLLKKNNIPTDKITWANAGGNAQRLQAIIAGKIDAAAVPTYMEDQIKGQPNFHVLARIGTDLPEYARNAVIVNEDAIAKKRDALQRYVIALSKGLRDAVRDQKAYVDTSLKANDAKEDQRKEFETAWKIVVDQKLLNPDMKVNLAQLDFLQDMNVAMGAQKEKFPSKDVVDPSFYEQEIKELGAFKW